MDGIRKILGDNVSVVERGDIVEFFYGDKEIGTLKKRLFMKDVYKPDHYMNKKNTYGMDSHVIDYLAESPCEKIVIVDERGEQWLVNLKTLLQESKYENYGYGLQRFLPAGGGQSMMLTAS